MQSEVKEERRAEPGSGDTSVAQHPLGTIAPFKSRGMHSPTNGVERSNELRRRHRFQQPGRAAAVNEDFVAALRAAPGDEDRGLIAAIADGVSTGGRGLEAAQTTVMSLVLDYHAAPETWDTTVVLDRLIGAQNTWLADHNRRRQALGSDDDGPARGVGLTTLTALVLRGHAYTLAHVGDTRAWLLRDGSGGAGADRVQLTHDHAFDHPDQRSRLTRAVGLDDRVRVDFVEGELQAGDVFVLTSDGVHGVLPRRRLAALALAGDAQTASEALVSAALDAGSNDNATALVMQVRGLAGERVGDTLLAARRLPVPGALKVGDRARRLHRHRAGCRQRRAPALPGARCCKRAAGGAQDAARGAGQRRRGARHAGARGLAGGPRRRGGGQCRGAFRSRATGCGAERASMRSTTGTAAARSNRGCRTACVSASPRWSRRRSRSAAPLGRLHRHGIVHRDIKPGNLHRATTGAGASSTSASPSRAASRSRCAPCTRARPAT